MFVQFNLNYFAYLCFWLFVCLFFRQFQKKIMVLLCGLAVGSIALWWAGGQLGFWWKRQKKKNFENRGKTPKKDRKILFVHQPSFVLVQTKLFKRKSTFKTWDKKINNFVERILRFRDDHRSVVREHPPLLKITFCFL